MMIDRSKWRCHRWPLVLAVVAAFLAISQSVHANPPHYVFAHYMVCYADYGDFGADTNSTIAGYKREIQEAQAAGIDGFALDVADWTNSGPNWYYKGRVPEIYQAAESLGTGFKLFFSVELTNTAYILDMITNYAGRTNTFHYNGQVVVSTYGQGGVDWSNQVFKPLGKQGISVFFVPYFVVSLDYQGASNLLATNGSFINGLFDFACGTAQSVTNVNLAWGQACQQAGKIFMAGCSPDYWGCAQTNRGYIENQGGIGADAEWQSIIQQQPAWVEIVTWNDFGESTYVSPVDNPGNYEAGEASPQRYCHAGFLELYKRYITWYKTGVNPPITQDALYYFYRIHSTNAVATNDIPVTVFHGNVQDAIYATTCLTAPAQLVIASGLNITTNSLPAGMNQVIVPFAPGPQTFTVTRSGVPVISTSGPNILPQIQLYDYFENSGYVYGLTPPANLNASPAN
jgi:glucan endo-1,3-alpha-glucosidase